MVLIYIILLCLIGIVLFAECVKCAVNGTKDALYIILIKLQNNLRASYYDYLYFPDEGKWISLLVVSSNTVSIKHRECFFLFLFVFSKKPLFCFILFYSPRQL